MVESRRVISLDGWTKKLAWVHRSTRGLYNLGNGHGRRHIELEEGAAIAMANPQHCKNKSMHKHCHMIIPATRLSFDAIIIFFWYSVTAWISISDSMYIATLKSTGIGPVELLIIRASSRFWLRFYNISVRSSATDKACRYSKQYCLIIIYCCSSDSFENLEINCFTIRPLIWINSLKFGHAELAPQQPSCPGFRYTLKPQAETAMVCARRKKTMPGIRGTPWSKSCQAKRDIE